MYDAVLGIMGFGKHNEFFLQKNGNERCKRGCVETSPAKAQKSNCRSVKLNIGDYVNRHPSHL